MCENHNKHNINDLTIPTNKLRLWLFSRMKTPSAVAFVYRYFIKNRHQASNELLRKNPQRNQKQNLSRRAFRLKTQARQIWNRSESRITQRREVIKHTMWVVISKTSTDTHCDAYQLIKSQPRANHFLFLALPPLLFIKQLHWLAPEKVKGHWLISQVSIGGADIAALQWNGGVVHSS